VSASVLSKISLWSPPEPRENINHPEPDLSPGVVLYCPAGLPLAPTFYGLHG
jgi:hypothetical protein